MRLLGKRLVFAAPALLACSSSYSGAVDVGGFSSPSSDGLTCTEDAGVLTPIGPQGCGPSETIVYRKPLAGSGASGITSAAGTVKAPQPAMVAACTATKCGPGQVAVVDYQPTASGDPLADAATAPGDGAATADGGALVEGGARRGGDAGRDAGAAIDGATLDGASLADGDASSPLGDAGPGDAAAPDATPRARPDASGAATMSVGDAGAIGIPCGAVITCIDAPPSCPDGQSPSYTPNGKWHCLPQCDPNGGSVLITYGATYGNTVVCAGPPPTSACPAAGQVWTWDYQDEEWVCAAECNNGQYDQHVYGGQTVCVPC